MQTNKYFQYADKKTIRKIVPKPFAIIFGLLILSLVIFVHELGHFTACKLFGVQTPIFSIGFGTPIIQKKIGDTTFQIAVLLLGGYVSMNGKDLEKSSYWQKMIITLAGIFNNFLLAYIFLLIIFFLNRTGFQPIIKKVRKKSPAKKAGLQIGDRIVRIDDALIDNNAQLLLQTIQAQANQEIILTIDRNGSIHEIPIKLSSFALVGSTIGYLGIILQKDLSKKSSIFTVVNQAWSTLHSLMRKTFYLITGLLKPKTERSITGPVNISHLMQKNLQTRLSLLLLFIAFISIELGIFNVLPIPMLDGGQAFVYTIEAFAGKLEPTILTFIYLVLLILFVLYLNRRKQRKLSEYNN